MSKQLKPAVLMLLFFTVVTGLMYPLFTTAVAQLVFPREANGSLIEQDGKLVGSALIGQQAGRGKHWQARWRKRSCQSTANLTGPGPWGLWPHV